jgi:hypothetical protein
MWYGLMIDGELELVQQFNRKPSVYEFGCSLSSWREYEIVILEIHIVGRVG